MDFRRTTLWVIFLLSGLFLVDGYQKFTGQPGFFAPTPKANVATSAATPKAAGSADAVPASAISTAANTASVPGASATAAASAQGKIIKLSNSVLTIQVDTAGGNVVGAELLKHRDDQNDKQNVVLLQTGNKPYLAQSGFLGETASKATLPSHTAATVYAITAQSDTSLALEATVDGAVVKKTIALAPDSYSIAVNHSLSNTGAAPIQATLYLQLLRHGASPEGESQFYATFTGPAVYTEEKKFQKIDFTDIEKGKAKFQKITKDAEPAWLAVVQHYFVSAWVAKENKARELEVDAINGADGGRHYRVRSKQVLAAVAPGASLSHDATLYVGPQDQDVLEKLAPGLELVVDYGIFTIFAKPMFAALKFFHGLTGNWGWAIVLLTLCIKALLYFPMAMSYRSMAKMKNVAPKLKELQTKFADDKTKLNQAMMELYRTEKINPLGGCLPILLTIPIFMALYWVLLGSTEMRNAPWIGWITSLSHPDPWYILPVLLAATMWAQFKLSPAPPDPMQARMMMIMQGVFAIMFVFFPAGLNLYYFVNNLLSILQQWYITRTLEKEGLQARPEKKIKK